MINHLKMSSLKDKLKTSAEVAPVGEKEITPKAKSPKVAEPKVEKKITSKNKK